MKSLRPNYPSCRVAALIALVLIFSVAFAGAQVTTYHYDTRRTGWNSKEPKLTPANVGARPEFHGRENGDVWNDSADGALRGVKGRG